MYWSKTLRVVVGLALAVPVSVVVMVVIACVRCFWGVVDWGRDGDGVVNNQHLYLPKSCGVV